MDIAGEPHSKIILQWGSTRRRSSPCKTSQEHLETKPSKPPQNSSVKPAKHLKRRGLWTEESMRAALLDIQSGRMKLREASRHHSIPESSIHAWQSGKVKSKRSGPETILTSEEEKQLVE